MKTLILYYSYGGNTRKIAHMLKQETGADLEEIETLQPYEGSYDEVVDRGHREVNEGFMPEIKPLKAKLSDYDCIVLGSPVWWYTFAPAMRTCLEQYDFSGKIIYPFATNGGWIGHTFQDFEKCCKGARVRRGINIRFEEDVLLTADAEIRKWAKEIGR